MRVLLKSGGPGQKIVVLWGLSGFGKTQLALQFRSLFADDYTSKIWIDASQAESLTDLTVDIAASQSSLLPDRSPSSPTQPFSRIKAWLALDANKKWLLIIDNVENLDGNVQIQRLLPQCSHGTVIITTTRSNLVSAVRGKGIEVGRIDEEAGMSMLQEKFPSKTYSCEGKFLITPCFARVHYSDYV
jgi:hypothetical protein